MATEFFVGRKPSGGIAVGFLFVGGSIDGEKIERVSGKFVAFGLVESLSAFLPSIGKSDDMVDLDAIRDLFSAGKNQMFASVGFVKLAGDDIAFFQYSRVAEFAFDDALAERAAIYGGPTVVELFPTIVGLRGAAFNF